MMTFRVLGLNPGPFIPLYGLSDEDLARKGVQRHIADSAPGYPDRIEMRDAEPGEALLLLNFEHLPVDTTYRSSHAIFVREGADQQYDQVGVVPDVIAIRQLSVRSFDAEGDMLDADLTDGADAASLFGRFLENERAAYLHVHKAKRGCYTGRVERA